MKKKLKKVCLFNSKDKKVIMSKFLKLLICNHAHSSFERMHFDTNFPIYIYCSLFFYKFSMSKELKKRDFEFQN